MRTHEYFYEIEDNLPEGDGKLEKNSWKEYESMKNALRGEGLDSKTYELKIREIADFLGI